ncbi:MAG: hypothetical protein KDC84_08785 [Crocinitomicaceae bacterium]|nr:hypothetical protein [Crocinitomicaceae bacterium]
MDSTEIQGLPGIIRDVDSFDVVHYTEEVSLDLDPREHLLFYSLFDRKSDWTNQSYLLKRFSKILPYYDSKVPVLEVFYSLGRRNTHNLNAFFTQNIRPNINYTLDYNLAVSNGFLRRSRNDGHQIRLSFNARFKRYKLFVQGYWEKMDFQENGGIIPDSNQRQLDLDLIPVLRTNARRQYINGGLELNNYFSLDTNNRHKFRLSAGLDIKFRLYQEEDSLAGLYSNIYYDSTFTNDKFQISTVNGLASYVLNLKRLELDVGYKVQYYQAKNLGVANYLDNYVHFMAILKYDKVKMNAYFDYDFYGRNQNAITAKFDARFAFGIWRFGAYANYYSSAGMLDQEKYLSNNYQIDTSRAYLSDLKVGLDFQIPKTNLILFADVNLLDKPIYFDSLGNMIQHDGQILNFRAGFKGYVKFWKFKNDFDVYYMGTSKQDIFLIPDVYIGYRFYFDGKLFKKKKLHVQLGVGLRYFNSMRLYAFNNALSVYQIGNTNGANFPYLDAFINMKLGKASFFFKVYNITAMFYKTPSDIRIAEGYPVNPFQFRVGLRWRFLN